MQIKASVKHLQINKANNAMFIAVAVASVITVFSLVSAKALLAQSSYQHKVLKARNKAVKTLKSNVSAANNLKEQYDAFESQNPNIIGGVGGDDIAKAIVKGAGSSTVSVNGNAVTLGNQDGDNAKIILDALPSSYDFPALISSIEKIAKLENIQLDSVGGTDDSANLSGAASATAAAPSAAASTATISGSIAKPINFSVGAKLSYDGSKTLVKDFERSIRPMDITQFSLSGSDSDMAIQLQLATYYQDPTSLQIVQKAVK
jgi:hypothetical protein